MVRRTRTTTSAQRIFFVCEVAPPDHDVAGEPHAVVAGQRRVRVELTVIEGAVIKILDEALGAPADRADRRDPDLIAVAVRVRNHGDALELAADRVPAPRHDVLLAAVGAAEQHPVAPERPEPRLRLALLREGG